MTYGQVSLLKDIGSFIAPEQIRVKANFLPDITIRPGEDSFVGRLLAPEVIVLTKAGLAFKISGRGIEQADASIFQEPTFLDRVGLPGLIGIALVTFALARRVL